jgi:hypothetical protein
MNDGTYSALAELISGWFHQDFGIEGSTVSEVMKPSAP